MTRTGIFATDQEAEVLKKLLISAQATPVMALSSSHALRGGLSGDAWHHLKTRCHEVAMSHGLPEIDGFYGLDLETKEFVSA